MNARVGPALTTLPTGVDEQGVMNQSYVRNRWTDAIILYPDRVIIVEAKMQPDPGIFSQLLHYARMFRLDPNFASVAALPLQLVALVYRDDPEVSIEAPWYGITWTVYQPALTDFPPVYSQIGALTGVPSPLPQDWASRLKSWGIIALKGF